MLILHVVLLVFAGVCFLLSALGQIARVQWQPLGLLFLTLDLLARLAGGI
jgi:hypothetical protein